MGPTAKSFFAPEPRISEGQEELQDTVCGNLCSILFCCCCCNSMFPFFGLNGWEAQISEKIIFMPMEISNLNVPFEWEEGDGSIMRLRILYSHSFACRATDWANIMELHLENSVLGRAYTCPWDYLQYQWTYSSICVRSRNPGRRYKIWSVGFKTIFYPVFSNFSVLWFSKVLFIKLEQTKHWDYCWHCISCWPGVKPVNRISFVQNLLSFSRISINQNHFK